MRATGFAAALAAGIAAGVATGFVTMGLTAGAAWATSPADIQWVQEALRDKGYDIGGRAVPRVTDGARRAISKYQAAKGLPVTGEPDQATIDKLQAERAGDKGRNATVGNLAAPKSGGSGGGHAVRESAPQPKAAPTTRVDSAGQGDIPMLGVSTGRTPNPALIPSGTDNTRSDHRVQAAGGAPTAASRATTPSTLEDAPSPVAAPAAAMAVSGDTVGGDDTGLGFKASNWMRYLVGGVLALTVGALGFGWWRSGRRQLPEPGYGGGYGAGYGDDDHPHLRRDPVFGKPKREELSAGLPPLSATAPVRGRR